VKRIAVIDCGSGNIFSVLQALKKIGVAPVVTNNIGDIVDCDAIILPGVGSFENAMQNLKKDGLINQILDSVENGVPLLGICLGLQLLFESSAEFGSHEGLKLIKGEVVKFSALDNGSTIPQMQWNKIKVNVKDTILFNGISENPFMYFAHSYYVKPSQPNLKVHSTNYGGIEYCCAIEYKNLFGVQFHPEKSSLDGLRVLKNFTDHV
jgi:glutamine amidotransferase